MAPRKKQQRIFKSEQRVMHDLYKLDVASAIKNSAWQPGTFSPETIEHCHFFHSIDKGGVPQKACTHSNGHFHEMIMVREATADEPAEYKCGPAQRWAKVNVNGNWVKRAVPADFGDKHTHEIIYRGSEEFKPAKINSEAMKLISEKSREPEAVPGIIG